MGQLGRGVVRPLGPRGIPYNRDEHDTGREKGEKGSDGHLEYDEGEERDQMADRESSDEEERRKYCQNGGSSLPMPEMAMGCHPRGRTDGGYPGGDTTVEQRA